MVAGKISGSAVDCVYLISLVSFANYFYNSLIISLLQTQIVMNKHQNWGMLIIRLALGLVFLAHGIQKFTDLAGVEGFFESVGIPAPGAMAVIVALVEALGGLAIIFGVGMRIAAALIAIVMVVAIVTVKFSAGFFGGYELDLVLLLVAIGLILAHPGEFAIQKPKMTGSV